MPGSIMIRGVGDESWEIKMPRKHRQLLLLYLIRQHGLFGQLRADIFA